MADNWHSVGAEKDDNASKGTVSMPIPILCRLRMLPNETGWCERTEKVIEINLPLRGALIITSLKRKESVIVELTKRNLEWNDMICPECYASLNGKAPQVLDEHKAKIMKIMTCLKVDPSPLLTSKILRIATRSRQILEKS